MDNVKSGNDLYKRHTRLFPDPIDLQLWYCIIVLCDCMQRKIYKKKVGPQHEISNNVVYATSKGSDQPVHTRSLIRAFASRYNIRRLQVLTEQHLEFLSLKGGCTGLPESTLVKKPHCWKTHVTAQILVTLSY